MKQIQANRLVGLVNMLDALPKEAIFNLSHWGNKYARTTKPTLKAALDCGTSACAVGWAILLIPAWKKHFKFMDQGLALNSEPDVELSLNTIYYRIGEFTGISSTVAAHLFAPYEYNNGTRSNVSKRITKVLADNGYSIH